MLSGTRVASDGAGFSFDVFKGGESADQITVPDAHLLFSGDFQRSGSFDLKITGEDGKSFMVLDYFRPEKRATLKSPEGAALTADIVEALAGPLAPGQYAQAAQQPAATEVIGRVASVTGNATVLRNGVTVTLNAGDAIQKGDVVQTGSGSTLGLTFIDGSTFTLTAGARMVINEFVYEQGGSNNASLMSLVQGAANFVAGQVAKTGDMKVATPVATMGIRGTAVILDISSTDGRVTVSVIDQRDNQDHTVEMFAPNGTLLGIARSQGGTWVITPTASLQVLAQEIGKTPQQIAQEFAAFQTLLNTYDAAKQFFPNLPEHTEVNPKNTQEAKGTQIQPSDGGAGALNAGGNKVTVLVSDDSSTNGNNNNNNPNDGDGPGPGSLGDGPPPPTEFVLTPPGFGGPGNDTLVGTSGQDFMFGFAGNDTITAEGGDDFVFGGAGDDTIVAGHGEGDDYYDGDGDGLLDPGEAGIDTITFKSTHDGVFVNLSDKDECIEVSDGQFVHLDANSATGSEIGTDVVLNIENVTGGDGDDILIGTDGANIIDGYGGTDGMFGGGGNDIFLVRDDASWFVQGGSGIDILSFVGSFDIREGQDEGPHVENIEIIDLNTEHSNIVDIDAEGIAEMNCDGVIRVLGGPSDHINVMSDFFGHPNGHWIYVGPVGDLAAFGADDHFSDGVTFDLYQFVDGFEGEDVLATAYVQQGIGIEVVEKVTVNIHTPSGFDLSGAWLYPAMVNSEVGERNEDYFLAFADTNNDVNPDIYFKVIGTDLAYDEGEFGEFVRLTGGQIHAIEIWKIQEGPGLKLVEATGFDFSAAQFWQALQDFDQGDSSGLDAIFQAVTYHATGGAGHDVFEGGNYSDHVNALAGDDTIIGGAGSDIIVFGPNSDHDTVIDFSIDGGDRIDLVSYSNLHSMFDVGPLASQDGADTLINFGNGDTLRLAGIDVDDLNDNHFIFNQTPVLSVTPPSKTLVEDDTNTSNVTVTKSDPDQGDATHYDMNGWTPTALGGDAIFQGHFYRFISGAADWNDARQQALNLHGYLANITSADENAFIHSSVTQGQFAFIGGSDAAEEGVWKWMDGPEAGQTFGPSDTDHAYVAWWGDEPNNLDGVENYVYIDTNALWTDDDVAAVSGFVVEFSDLNQFTEFSLGGTYGHAVFNTVTGLLTYHLNNSDPDTQALAKDQVVTESFVIVAKDSHGAGDSETVNFTINGANDAPVIQEGVPDPGPITAPAGTPGIPLVFSNNFSFSDVDKTDTHDVTWAFNDEASNLAYNFGTFIASELSDTSNGTGGLAHWEFSVDPEAVNSLATGEYFAVYDVIVSDHEGGSDTHQVTITINGTNDAGGGNQAPVANDDILAPEAGFTYNPANGHLYKINTTKQSWTDARDAAAALGGYLATVTSGEENGFVNALRAAALGNNATQDRIWLGGSDDPTLTGGAQGAWFWVTGPESGLQFWTGDEDGSGFPGIYETWLDSEPNEGAGEDFLLMRTDGTWNDFAVVAPNPINTPASVIEFDGFSEDQPVVFSAAQLLVNDFDVDGSVALQVTGVSCVSANGALVSLTDGVITYDPTNAAALQALSAGEIGTDTFTYTISDGEDADTATVTIKVVGVNDAPVVTTPAQAPVTDEDEAVAINGFGVADADDGSLTVTLTASSTLTLRTTSGLEFNAGDGTGDGTMTFTGSIANINQALAGMTYTPTPDFFGTGNIAYSFSDGDDTTSGNIAININPVYDVASDFVTLDVPGASVTYAIGINDLGQIVGQKIVSGRSFGWQYSEGEFTTIEFDGAPTNTSAGAINDSGVVVGYYEPVPSTPRYGFIYNGGEFTPIDLSPHTSTTTDGINNAGAIAGSSFQHGGTTYSGYFDLDGDGPTAPVFFSYPGSFNTRAVGINDAGDVVGFYDNAHGFLYQPDGDVSADDFTSFDYPSSGVGAFTLTFAVGINDSGDIVGWYTDSGGKNHGFLKHGDTFYTIDNPLGVNGTFVSGINDSGQIVGWYADNDGVNHGFTATITINEAPVINTDDSQTESVMGDSTKLSNLSVSDADAGDDPLTVTVSAEDGTLAPANPNLIDDDESPNAILFNGSFNEVNSALADGIIHTPGAAETDKVTLTVDDGLGGIDITNFVFANSPATGVALTGTDYKDVLYSTGLSDTLAGGDGNDIFLFNFHAGFESGDSQDLIWDFNVAEDKIRLDNFDDVPLGDDFSEGDLQAWISADGITQDELGAVISLGDGNMILLANVAVEDLHAANFVSHNNGGMVA